MLQARTKHFATIEYDEAAVLTFPDGLPAFEHLSRFLLIEQPSAAPLVFLQSLEQEDLCLPAIPVLALDPDYELALSADDLETLGFTTLEQPPGGDAIGCFAVVSVPAMGPASANLLAPIVVNLASRRAVQSVRGDTRYSHKHPLVAAGAGEAICS